MTISEARQLCKDNGIHQLNKGETLKDALKHIQNGTPRKGYRVKADDGRKLTRNEILGHENKAAFSRSFTPAEFNQDEVESIDDITDEDDKRDDRSKRGVIINCHYCGTCLRVDGGDETEDYDCTQPETHCDGCMNDAIMNLCM